MATVNVVVIDPESPDPSVIERAGQLIREGRLVAFPTETVYGLGASALDAVAIARIYAAKGRPASNPIIAHVSTVEQARSLASPWPEVAEALAKRFWPGPLTIVVRKVESAPAALTAGRDTIAIRWPAHRVAESLIRAAGVPIAAPSANRSTNLSPTTAEHVSMGLGGDVDLILDGGRSWRGIESTVLDVSVERPRLLRPGPIGPVEIEEVIGPIERPREGESDAGAAGSPGRFPRHYAPKTPLELATDNDAGVQRATGMIEKGSKVGLLPLGAMPRPFDASLTVVTMPRSPADYASDLFASLHRLDAMGLDRIVAVMPPKEDNWLAIRDRLLRAAAPAQD